MIGKPLPDPWRNDYRRKNMAEQVELTLMDHSPEFDIEGIVDDILNAFPDVRNIDSLQGQEYWTIVHQNDLLDPSKRQV